MPAFWISISPASIYSPILMLLAGKNINLDLILDPNLPSPQERAQIATHGPVAAARFFNIVTNA